MFEFIGKIVVLIILLYLACVIISVLLQIRSELRKEAIERRSSYREAFLMEFSEKDLKSTDNKFAQELDKAITAIDKADWKVKQLRAKLDRDLESMNMEDN